LIIAEILKKFFLSVMQRHKPTELAIIIHLCLSRLGPEYEGLELGVGEALLIKAISQTTGRSVKLVKGEIEEKGDIGLVAQNSKSNQGMLLRPPPLTVFHLFKVLKEIALATGQSVT
jgi:DNA ligase-1